MAESIAAIIPAYNEADIIADTVKAALGIPGVSELIVVDDGSSDRTSDVSKEAGAGPVIRLDKNGGKGAALNRALEVTSADILLLLDADLGQSAEEGVKLLRPVLNGEADMAIALFTSGSARTTDGLSARSGGLGLVLKTAQRGIRTLTGKQIDAALAGPRAFKREIVEKAGGFEPRFGVEVGLTIDALRLGYRVLEVPVCMVHRPSGRSIRGFKHRGAQMCDVILTLMRKALKR